jgi:hypothetical protein
MQRTEFHTCLLEVVEHAYHASSQSVGFQTERVADLQHAKRFIYGFGVSTFQEACDNRFSAPA